MRRDDRSVSESCGFFVVHDGLEPVDQVETCKCSDLGYERNTVRCRDCGTVYGVAAIKTFRSGWSRMSWQVDFGSAV